MPNKNGTKGNNGISAAKVGIGLAGAVAGATAGIAFADEKTRKKIMTLASDAQNAFQKLMDSIQGEVENLELPEKAKDMKKDAKKVAKDVKKEVSRRT